MTGAAAMSDPATIRKIVDRNIQILAHKPSRGLLTRTTRARLAGGLRCEIEEDGWRLAADMPAKVGGEDTAPTPGTLGRGALASCLTIGIATWAVRMGVPISSLEVAVEADFDARGELGLSNGSGEDVPAGYSAVRYAIAIESPADEGAVNAVLDRVERHSPYLEVFGRPVALSRTVRLNGRELDG